MLKVPKESEFRFCFRIVVGEYFTQGLVLHRLLQWPARNHFALKEAMNKRYKILQIVQDTTP